MLLLAALLLAAPDLIIVNAELPTLGGTQPADSDAFAVTAGKISAIGASKDILAQKGPKTEVIDARERMVVPGFIDAHVHFLNGGLENDHVDLHRARSIADVWDRLDRYAKDHPLSRWIVGRGWDYELFETFDPPYPSRALLDKLPIDKPIYLRSYDGHAAWANTKALEVLGITAAMPDPDGGKIVREKDGKTPHGTLLERAQGPYFAQLPPIGDDRKKKALQLAQTQAIALGITTIDDFDSDPTTADLYTALEKQGALDLNVFVSPPLSTPIADLKALRDRLLRDSKKVRLGSLKHNVDGVVEANAAAFFEPYGDNPKMMGDLIQSEAALVALMQPAHEAGFSISLHATGDRAVNTALNAFERLLEKRPQTDAQHHRIEHVEILKKGDAERFTRMRIAASMHPFHALPGDEEMKTMWERKVGKARFARAFAWRELQRAGAQLVFGSDWPALALSPLKGVGVAMSRKNGRGLPARGFVPEQALSLSEAVIAYTNNGATVLNLDNVRGEIEVGQAADFVVLSDTIEPDEALSFFWGAVDYTFIEGRKVYER
ncbi:MAG: amidohydrolase [Deltaproteobacteria bacterium]|nr:amidohydrolase [Deltaproteobacteria bacterium]